EADRGLLPGDLANLDERLESPQLTQVVLDELARERRVRVHRERPVVGGLEVEGDLRPGGEQLLEQIRRLDGEAPRLLSGARGGAHSRGPAARSARHYGPSCA